MGGLGRIDRVPVIRVGFRLRNDGVHHADRLNRIFARCGFSRKHHGVGTVVNGSRHVRRFGPGWHRRGDHGFQHLGGHDHRFASLAAGAHDALLNSWHLLRGHFHAQIAARHHDRVAFCDDGIQTVDGRGLFQLGHNLGTALDDVFDFHDVFGTLHKRQSHPVDTQRQAVVQISPVLLGQGREGQHNTRHIHALAVRHDTTGNHPGFGKVRAKAFHPQAHAAVIDEQVGADFQRIEDLGVGHGCPGLVAGDVPFQVQPKRGPLLQSDGAFGESSQTQFGALQIEQDTNRSASITLNGADGVESLFVIFMRSMTEVQAKDIRPSLKQRLNGFTVSTRWTQGSDDLGVTVTVHFSNPCSIKQSRSRLFLAARTRRLRDRHGRSSYGSAVP